MRCDASSSVRPVAGLDGGAVVDQLAQCRLQWPVLRRERLQPLRALRARQVERVVEQAHHPRPLLAVELGHGVGG
jgi:hypothetical protein